MEIKLFKIQQLEIKNKPKQRIDVYLDVFNNKIIFKGCYKEKFEKETRWECIHEISVIFDGEEIPQFDVIMKDMINEMEKRIQVFHLVKSYFDNADLLVIDSSED